MCLSLSTEVRQVLCMWHLCIELLFQLTLAGIHPSTINNIYVYYENRTRGTQKKSVTVTVVAFYPYLF